jgi:D-alanyl-D-alanine carboxypeptidase (penicillin-binding protein 5/6)
VILGLLAPLVAAADDAEQLPDTGDTSVISGCHSPDAHIAVLGNTPLVSNIQSAFVYELSSETLMYAWNADLPMDPASLVKIMTAYIATERGNLDDIVTVKQSVIDTVPYDAVSADLVADEVMTLEDLLLCMMVGSANDAAVVIADYIGGDIDSFVALMNETAQHLNCTGTAFTNPHGLYNAQQYTTARDVGKILETALNNEHFARIFTTVSHTVPATNKSSERRLTTGNFLMTQDDMEIYFDSRVTGGRTGTAQDGTRCLAISATSGDMTLISVVAGAKSVYKEDGYTVQSFGGFNETKQLLDNAFSGYKSVQVIAEGQVLLQKELSGSTDVLSYGAKSNCYAVLPENIKTSDLNYRYVDINEALELPVEKGTAVSSVEIWYGGMCVAQSELYALNSVSDQPIVTVKPIDQDSSSVWSTIAWIVMFVAIAVVGIIVGFRIANKYKIAKRNRRSRRHRQDRRRNV